MLQRSAKANGRIFRIERVIMAKKENRNWDNLEPQKSSAAQFLTYVASVGQVDERYEIRYEDENIWMSQKMLAQVYGVEVPNIAYHLRKLFDDAELDKNSVIKEILITGSDGKNYHVKHYDLRVIIALGFKIDNDKAIAFRKWANQIVSEFEKYRVVQDKLFMSDYDRYLIALEEEIKKNESGGERG